MTMTLSVVIAMPRVLCSTSTRASSAIRDVTVTYAARAKNATAMTRRVPFSQRSGSRRLNCQATAAAERTSMVESSPNAMSAAEDAMVPAVMATTASIRL